MTPTPRHGSSWPVIGLPADAAEILFPAVGVDAAFLLAQIARLAARYGGKVFTSYARLAGCTGLTKRQVRRQLDTLRKAKLVTDKGGANGLLLAVRSDPLAGIANERADDAGRWKLMAFRWAVRMTGDFLPALALSALWTELFRQHATAGLTLSPDEAAVLGTNRSASARGVEAYMRGAGPLVVKVTRRQLRKWCLPPKLRDDKAWRRRLRRAVARLVESGCLVAASNRADTGELVAVTMDYAKLATHAIASLPVPAARQ